jgi:hypothetical protein
LLNNKFTQIEVNIFIILLTYFFTSYASSPIFIKILISAYLLIYLLKELSPSKEAANCAATQELPSILRNPKIHYRVHKSPPLVPILSQVDPVRTISSYLSKINFNIAHPLTTHVLVFLVISFLLAFAPISYMHSSSESIETNNHESNQVLLYGKLETKCFQQSCDLLHKQSVKIAQ